MLSWCSKGHNSNIKKLIWKSWLPGWLVRYFLSLYMLCLSALSAIVCKVNSVLLWGILYTIQSVSRSGESFYSITEKKKTECMTLLQLVIVNCHGQSSCKKTRFPGRCAAYTWCIFGNVYKPPIQKDCLNLFLIFRALEKWWKMQK